MSKLSFTRKGVARIPKGYRWCDECQLLTPFKEVKGSFSGYACKVCGESSPYDGCDNCGAEIPELSDNIEMKVIHEKGCHFIPLDSHGYDDRKTWASFVLRDFTDSWMRQAPSVSPYAEDTQSLMKRAIGNFYKERLEEEKKRLCNCPVVPVFSKTDLSTVEYNSYPYYSMDCWNAVSWDYVIRCKICGYLNRRSDDSC